MKIFYNSLKWFVFIIVIILLSISSIACDADLGIKGSVYEWVNPPDWADSHIIYIESLLDEPFETVKQEVLDKIDFTISPLAGVEIAIGPKESIEKRGDEEYLWKTISDSEGNIDDFWSIAPGKDIFRIKASKMGYKEAIWDTEHGNIRNHLIIVILVKDN